MTERPQHSAGSAQQTVPRRSPPPLAVDVSSAQTVPRIPTARADGDPDILGFSAEASVDDEDAEPATAVGWPAAGVERLVVLRRADRLGGIVLVLAGVAAGLSLTLPWMGFRGASGLTLVLRGFDVLGSGVAELAGSSRWQPMAVVLAGGLLFLFGLLLFLPGHAHRFIGVLALLVALAAATGVLFLLAGLRWQFDRVGLGLWLGIAVAGLGVLGALKAMLTGPRVTIGPN